MPTVRTHVVVCGLFIVPVLFGCDSGEDHTARRHMDAHESRERSVVDGISGELKTQLREYIREQVVAGFYDQKEIVTVTLEVFIDDGTEESLRPFVETVTREVYEKAFAEQASWPETTDCDRLDLAFADLERKGIVSRQDFTCCGTCGVAEIGAEVDEYEKAGTQARGYTFYHSQDTESAALGHGLYLNYGSVKEGEAAALAIGREVVRTLEENGLETKWDGSWKQRIGVVLEWKRRLTNP